MRRPTAARSLADGHAPIPGGEEHGLPEIRITLPAPPSANEYWVPAAGGRGLVPSHKALRYKAEVAGVFMLSGELPLAGSCHLMVTTHIPPARDIGANVLKVLEDALNTWAWLDDHQMDSVLIVRGRPSLGAATVDVAIRGDRVTSAGEAEAYRQKKRETVRAQRRTRRINRALKQAAKLHALPSFVAPSSLGGHESTCAVTRYAKARCSCGRG